MSLEIEKKVLHFLLTHLHLNGWVAARVDDGGDDLIEVADKNFDQIIEDITAVEEATIDFMKDGKLKQVVYIMGNDWDCIADHAVGGEFEELMDQFDEEIEKMQNPNLKRETNTEFLNRLMEFSKHGALMQVFILDALTKAAQNTIDNSDKIKDALGPNPLISPNAWFGCAEELKAELDKHLK